MLYKNWQFVTYMEKYRQEKNKEKINKWILSPYLKKQATNISLKSFKLFLYMEVNKQHQKHLFFTESFICIYINSYKIIMNNLNSINLHNSFSLHNNMIKSLLFNNWITFQYNYTLITIVALRILCYV